MKRRIASAIGVLFLLAMMQPPLYTAKVNTAIPTETLQPLTVTCTEMEHHLTNYVGQIILLQGNITVIDWLMPASINYYEPHSFVIIHEKHALFVRINRTIFVFTTDPRAISTLEHARGHKIFSTYYATVVRNAGPSGGDSLFAYVRIDQIGKQVESFKDSLWTLNERRRKEIQRNVFSSGSHLASYEQYTSGKRTPCLSRI